MRAIDRKLLRDLWRLKMPLGAISLVMAAGVATMVMAFSMNASLRGSRDAYYERQRFADVFAQVKRAPESVADRIAALPGVTSVQTRVVHDVNLTIPGVPEPGSARLVSIPDSGEPALNAVYLRVGRMPEPGRASEVLVSEPFAEANHLLPGGTLGAVINGRWQDLTIVGVGLAPEFVYYVRAGEMLPDNRRSGVLWMCRSTLAEALDMEGAFNDVSIRLADQSAARDVILGVDALLDRYGCLGAFDRTDHISDRYLRDEFDQLKVMGSLTPAIFLSVAAFLVNVVLGRLVRTQREQLATLKAFGYTNAALARHVVLMALAVCLAGCLLGIAVGWTLGRDLTGVYVHVFRFPTLAFRVDPGSVVTGIAVAAASGVLGVLGALRWALRLSPAEAMRPEAPTEFSPTVLERLGVRGLPVRWRMAMRGIESHPWRSALGALGIAMSAAVLVLSNFALDAVEHMIDREYSASQRYDLAVTFNEPVSDSGVHSLRGVMAGDAMLVAEPVRVAAARLGCEQRSRRLGIVGSERGSTLHRLLDADARPVDVPPDGLLLSQSLADVLGVKPGGTVRVDFLEGRRRSTDIPVSGVFTGYLGLTAYMDRTALCRAMGEGPAITGAYVLEDALHAKELYQRLKQTPTVAAATSKRGMLEAFRTTIAENITRITLLHALFASVIAFGVVYNTARIAFAEQQRELATLRVLGFGRGEVGRMLLSEIALLTLIGVPLGLALGRALAWWLVRALETESYVFPLIISVRTYSLSALVTLGAAACSAWFVRRGIARLDLLATLKDAG